jgi:2-keto-4-pentenoate hydratase/2-oxohepta-3-ene-1,7-dioic acid hydratase in catechol pathway
MTFAELQPPGQVICGGMSYTAHNEELSGMIKIREEIKGLPFFFVKAQRAISKHGAPIVLPDIRSLVRKPFDPPYGQVTGEVELGIVIKDRTYRVKPEEAQRHILGYTIFNDISQRDLQVVGYPVSMTKGFHTFGPLGPHMVMAEKIPDPQNLRFELRVNGTTRQKGSLSDMIFTIKTLVSLASNIFMLERGDVVTTGSPPEMFGYRLHPGDVIEAEMEHIGIMRNPVVAQ